MYLSYLNNTQCEQKYALRLAVKLTDYLRMFKQSTPTYGQELTQIHRNRGHSGPLTYGRGRLMAGDIQYLKKKFNLKYRPIWLRLFTNLFPHTAVCPI